MARIFITGSADGLGRAAAQTLLDQGHRVVLHLRHTDRLPAVQALRDRQAEVVVGDLADPQQTQDLAEQVNALGTMDAVIHNAGVYQHPSVMAVNVLAPYLLTARMHRPQRLVVLSSGLHRGGQARLERLGGRAGQTGGSYADSKLFVTTLAAALARRWPGLRSHAVDPGWVPTKMGGPHAPDDLRLGHLTQAWLATTDDPETLAFGLWHHQRRVDAHPAVLDPGFQAALLEALAQATGVALPG